MNPEEYANLERLESNHWFYVGKSQIVLHWLGRHGVLRREAKLADCGAGTGGFARKASERCDVLAVDDHAESLDILRDKLGPEQVKEGSCTDLPFADNTFDAVTALDVLEHISDDARAASEFVRILKPGGVLVITVPALQILWSDWDVALHHYRRYNRRSLEALLAREDLAIDCLHYINVFAFPLVLLARLWRKVMGPGRVRMEDKIPPKSINELLRLSFVAPACQQRVRFPFGVGLLAVCRKNVGS